MTHKLHVAEDFSLPLTAQTSTIIVYGAKGMGKTNFAAVFVEECHRVGLKFSVIDPLDVWWGLQHGANRAEPGLDIVILGGTRGDLPIDPLAGTVVADFVVDEDVSTVIVLRDHSGKMWTKGQKIRFVTDYTTRLYERQGEHRRPLVQIIDEAGRFVPQIAARGDIEIAKCIGAIEELVECGRNVAVGVVLITQRSARMAKSVSELADCMIAFRTVGPRSIDAIVDWFGEHVARERQKQLIAELRRLDIGTALVVSPGWLDYEGIASIRARRTFDSSATPKPGKSLRPPGPPRKPNLDIYKARMAETIERASAEDPRTLKARIVELERELKKTKKEPLPSKEIKVETVRHAIPEDVVKQIAVIQLQLGEVNDAVKEADKMAAQLSKLARKTDTVSVTEWRQRATVAAVERRASAKVTSSSKSNGTTRQIPKQPRTDQLNEALSLPPGALRLLTACAQSASCTSHQLTVLVGLKPSSRDTYLQRLTGAGLVVRDGDRFVPTQDGIDRLGSSWEPLPTGAALRDHWLNNKKLTPGEKKILQLLIDAYPNEVERDDLDAETMLKPSSRNTYLQKLSARNLVELIGKSVVRASEGLFE